MDHEQIKSSMLQQLQDVLLNITPDDVHFLAQNEAALAVQVHAAHHAFERLLMTSREFQQTIAHALNKDTGTSSAFNLGVMLTLISTHREFYDGLPGSDEVKKNGN